MYLHDCTGAECPYCSPFGIATPQPDITITYSPHTLLTAQDARLRTFRDSTGKAVRQWPKRVAIGTALIIPYGAHFREGGPWQIVIHQRTDNQRWGLPGGAMEIGESIGKCAIRECYEETGLTIHLIGVSSIDSDPETNSICQYPDGNVIQYCNVTFIGSIISGTLRKSEESIHLKWCSTNNLPDGFLPLHKWRIEKAIENIKDIKYNIAF